MTLRPNRNNEMNCTRVPARGYALGFRRSVSCYFAVRSLRKPAIKGCGALVVT
jgi:hypothetical protein